MKWKGMEWEGGEGEEVRKDAKKTWRAVEGKGKEGVRGEGKVELEVFIYTLHNRISPRLLGTHVSLPHRQPVTTAELAAAGLVQ